MLDVLEDEGRGEFTKIQIANFANRVAQLYKDDIEINGAKFVVKCDKQPLCIMGNEDQLLRLVENLLFNAVSFTPDGGTISLCVTRQGGYAVLTVSDTGEGIAAEKLPFVFEPYFSTRAADDSRGLGLSIVKQISASHGGSVEVLSRVNEGATFIVKIPLLE